MDGKDSDPYIVYDDPEDDKKMEFTKLREPNSEKIKISATTLLGYKDKILYYVLKTDNEEDPDKPNY